MHPVPRTALASVCFALTLSIGGAIGALQAGQTTAVIQTDRQDYQPITQVTITGSGWSSGETVSMLFHETGTIPDQPTDPDFTLVTVAHADGTLFYDLFWTDWHDVGVTFTVIATGLTSGQTAQTTFTDGPEAANLDQCANGGVGDVPTDCASSADWVNGNLNESKSHYTEGDSIPYRLRFSGLTPGAATHTVTIEWDAEKTAQHHAIDYLTTYNRTVTAANPCTGVLDCSGAPNTFPIPVDPHVAAGFDAIPGTADDITQLPGQFAIWGGTITAASAYTMSTSGTDSPTSITLTFTASVENPVLAWSGHIATRLDWGVNNSAIAISGSPYHMRLIDLDGSGGNQDRSLSAAAVFYPIQLTIVKQTDPDAAASHAFDFTTVGSFADSVGGLASTNPTFTLTPPNGTTAVSKVFYLPDTIARSVTESDPSPSFALSNLVCAQIDGGLGTGTVTTDLPARTASITTPKEGEYITCTFTNQQQAGSIKIQKVTVPSGSGQSFSFTTTGTGFARSFSLSDGQYDTTGGLVPGTGYTASETVPSGWDLTSATCDHGTISAIQVIANTTTTCTFTNTQRAQLRIEKVTLPDGDTTDFTFTPTNWNGGSAFTRHDNQAAFASGSLAPGATNYDTVETVPSGWALTDRACVLTGTSTAKTFSTLTNGVRVNLAAGEDVTCTFTNTKQSQLRIVKSTIPDGDTTDFTFTPANWNGGSPFTRRDDQAAFTSGYLTPGATNYDAVETVPSGWALTDRACVLTGTSTVKTFSSLTNGVRVNLGAGEDVTCTFTDTLQSQLHIVKATLPDGDTTDFTFTPANWNGGSTFTRRDNQAAFDSGYLAPGATNYDTTETVPVGWALTDRACVLTGTATVKSFSPLTNGIRVNLAAGENVTCTFTNTRQAQLHIVKSTLPDGNTTDFTFTPANWNGGSTFTRRDNQAAFDSGYLTPGATNYDAVETVPPGWALTDRACVLTGTATTRSFSPLTNGIRVNLAAGEDVTCTFTDTQQAQLRIVKATLPDGSATDFTFTPVNWNSGATFTRRDNQAAFPSGYLTPGATDYDTTETVPSGWTLTSRACVLTDTVTSKSFTAISNGVRVNLAPGEDVTCTFTNTQQATLIVKKVMVGGTDTFPFTSAVTALNSSISASGGTLTALVDPASYTATESAVSGWMLTSLSCVDPNANSSTNLGTQTATFNAQAGETITCTFTNTKLGTIIVAKQTLPDAAPGSFTFSGSASGSIGDNGQIVVSGLVPGAYSSTEADPRPNFDLTSVVCSDGNSTGSTSSRTASFNVEAGEVVVCTFTNTQRGLAKVVKTYNGQTLTGANSFTFQLRSGASASAAGSIIETLTATAGNGGVLNFATKLVVGTTYQMCEQMQPGWLTTLGPPLYSVFNPSGDNSVVCTDFTVTAGQTKEFAINNQPPPGGMSLTIGYWKNWASCAASKGKQAPILDRTVQLATLNYGTLTLTDTNGNLNVASDCQALVNLLNKLTVSGGKKMSSDPIFNMVAQLVAADLNVMAGAGLSVNAAAAVNQADALLVAIAFNGNNYSKPLSASNASLALCLATALDQSNNNRTVQSCGS